LAASVHELTAALEASGFQVVDVSGRVKNIYGVWKKVQEVPPASRGSSGSDSEDQEQQLPAVSPAAAAAAPLSPGSSDSNVRRQQLAAAVAQVYDIPGPAGGGAPQARLLGHAMRTVQDMWQVMPGRVKDYIRNREGQRLPGGERFHSLEPTSLASYD